MHPPPPPRSLVDPPAVRVRGVAHRAPKQYLLGTQRTMPPGETLARIRPHLQRAGITRLANITGLDRVGIPVTLALRPNSPTIVCSSGKGLTQEAALVSGAMEALELFHAERLSLPTVRAAYEELPPTARIPLEYLPLTRHSLFHPRRPYEWLLGWDLLGEREVAVPVQLVDMVRGRERGPELRPFQASTNGLASGNVLLEALAHGLLEAVERDATSCWALALERHGRHPPRVRTDTIDSPPVLELLERLTRAGLETFLFDCRVDTAIPVYTAYVLDPAQLHLGVFKGHGAHLETGVAMARALTEAVQARTVFIAGSRDDYFRARHRRTRHTDIPDNHRLIRELPEEVDAREHLSEATASFEADVAIILERLQRVGLGQVILFDLSRPDFPLHVMKTVVPGLEGPQLEFYSPGPRAEAFAAKLA
jgi:ribosomal protein S12 methylthiotransferase accessory factor